MGTHACTGMRRCLQWTACVWRNAVDAPAARVCFRIHLRQHARQHAQGSRVLLHLHAGKRVRKAGSAEQLFPEKKGSAAAQAREWAQGCTPTRTGGRWEDCRAVEAPLQACRNQGVAPCPSDGWASAAGSGLLTTATYLRLHMLTQSSPGMSLPSSPFAASSSSSSRCAMNCVSNCAARSWSTRREHGRDQRV